jgi:hypothetical protein
MRLCAEHGFAYYLAWGTIMQGWALTVQGQGKTGLSRMRGGLAAFRLLGPRCGSRIIWRCWQTRADRPGKRPQA